MRNAFATELLRSITGSWGRFLAIAGIVALGCGFYAGLSMTGSDMRLGADAFYDGTSLYDIRLVSTMGFSQSQADEVAGIDGVDRVMPGYATDVMATLNDEQYAMRVMSLDAADAAGSSSDATGTTVTSADDGYLNRLVLASGSWPANPGECVLSADRVMGTPIEVGDTVTVLYGTADLDGVLERRTFTVSGLVHSSGYVSSVGLGYTSLGSGVIQQYMYVSPDDFSSGLPYTELYVTVDGASGELAGSADYQSTVAAVEEKIGEAVPALAADRLAEVRAVAQGVLDERSDEYEAERSDVEGQLEDARAALDASLATLRDSEARIASGQASLDEGTDALVASKQEVAAQLAAGRQELEDAQTALDAQSEALDSSQSRLDEGLEQWQGSKGAWEAQRAQLQAASSAIAAASSAVSAILPTSTGSQVEACQGEVSTALAAAQGLAAQGTPGATAAAGHLEEVQGSLSRWLSGQADPAELAALATSLADDLVTVQDGVRQQSDEGDATIEQGWETLDYDASEAEVEAGREALDVRYASLREGWDSYHAQAAEAESALEVSQRQLDEAADELASARQQLAEGQASYEGGLAAYDAAAAAADSRLADAAQQLASAQATIDGTASPDVYVLDRTENSGVASYASDSERMDNIAAVFPFIFFLVAALVALTTMTRMVEDERVEIGTHKALGFSTARITAKYLAYAAIASAGGSVVGILALSQVLPFVVERAYAIIYNVPSQPFPLTIDPGIALRSAGMGVGVTLLATWAAAAATLRESPAALMLPRAPKAGRRILLERVGWLWHRLSFSWKVTLRNLFRYKRRLAMTVVGIAGCTALLLTGLGLRDAIGDIIDNQYGGSNPVFRYDILVGLDSEASADDVSSAERVLSDTGGAAASALADDENMQASSASHPDALALSVVVPDDVGSFSQLVSMRDRATQEPVAFDSHSVVLTEKMASRLGLSVGDTLTLYDQDEIGNATGSGYTLTVTGITENYVYHYCYVGADAYREATGRTAVPNAIYSSVGTGDDVRSALSAALHDEASVKTVTFNTETIDSYRKSLQSVNMIVIVLVTAAAALAFIVLYNLTNINIVERTREIASLKVLGFTPREVAAYVFREIGVLVVMGAAVGLALGVAMERFVVLSSEVDAVMFGRAIHPLSFAEAFGLTLGFSALVMAAMLPKLGRIDMVESLKSVD